MQHRIGMPDRATDVGLEQRLAGELTRNIHDRTIDRIEANGPYSVTLRLTRANAGLPTILTSRIG